MQEAEQDVVLERMILELHDASLESAQSIEVDDVLPLYTLLHTYSGTQTQEEADQQFSRGERKRYSRLTRIFQSLAAVLVIGALLSGFALLLAHHPGSTGSNITVSIVSPSRAKIVSLAVTNDAVYLAGSDSVLTARRPIDGYLLWSQPLPSNSSYLIAAGSVLYDAFDENTSAIVEARQGSNGHLLWRQQLPRLGPVPLRIGSDTLYVNTGRGLVFVLSTGDGHILWQFASGRVEPMDGFLYAAPGYVVIHSSNENAYVLNAQNGSQILSYQSNGAAWWPVIFKDTIYIHAKDGPFQAYRLSDGMLLWTSQQLSPVSDPWSLLQEIIYINTRGTLIALNTQNGLLLWQILVTKVTIVGPPSPTGTVIIAGPTVEHGQVYTITNSGSIVAFRITDGSPEWVRQLEHYHSGSPYAVLFPDGIYLTGPNTSIIDAWQSSTGKYLWHYTASAPILWEPRIANRIIYIWKLDGTMDVLSIDTGRILWRYQL